MSATINAKKLKFAVWGHGFENVRNDSGTGETGAQFFDKDGNTYYFKLMPVKIPKAPNTSGHSDSYVPSQGYTWSWSANSDGKRFANQIYAHFPDYGATYLQQLRNVGGLAWDIYENNIWFTPSKLNGFSAVNLIELGVLPDSTGASCRLYKNAPLSNTYIETVITSKKPDYFRDAVGTYENVNLTAYNVEFRFVLDGVNKDSAGYQINEFDGAICELEKYDGTKGLGMCVQGMSRIPSYESGGNPTTISTSQDCRAFNNAFSLLDVYFKN